jgi:cyclase
MLVKRIIPCLDVKDGRVVKGVKFVELKDVGDPAEIAILYEKEGADELAFLDISATVDKRKTMLPWVKKVVGRISIPLTVGGGIGSLEDIGKILEAGAGKIVINTAAVKNPSLVREASQKFGSQRIIVAIDTRKNPSMSSGYEVVIEGGRTPMGKDAIEWAKEVKDLGAGEILSTSIDADGTKKGYDIDSIRLIAEATGIPVIASGGAGNLEHLYQALTEGKADAVLAASIFHYREYTIREAKEYLKKKGVAVRF